MKRILLLTIGCALILGGCRGGPRGSASRVRQQSGTVVRPGWADELSYRKIRLVLSDYGKRLVGMHDRGWRNMILHPQGAAQEIEWLCRFGPLLELDAETEDGTEIARMNRHQARSAMVRYMTERIYAVKMSLSVVREGRRFLLGDYIDSYVRSLELRRSGGGFELIYKKDF